MRFLYSLLLYLLAPFVFLYFFWRGLREPIYLTGWLQRLGLGRKRPDHGLWVHAASVGEVQAAAPLIHALRERYPDRPLTLTCFTPTGLAHARRQLGANVDFRLLPLDIPGATRRFVKKQRPALLIIIEKEIWPNLLFACRQASVPVMFANARISEKSAKRYGQGLLRPLFAEALRRVDCIAASSESDAERFISLGVPDVRVHLTGNLKLDFKVPAAVLEQGRAWRQSWGESRSPVWVAGSTHEGEEAMVLAAHRLALAQFENLLLVLVPRHPARFQSVADLCRKEGFQTARRSENHDVTSATQVLLGDSLGELNAFYAAADVALVGGTLVKGIGGHNVLEPAALGVPVMVGQYLGGWAEASGWLEEEGALIRCDDAEALRTALTEALGDESGRNSAGEAARSVVQAKGGAVRKTIEIIETLIPS